MRQLKEIIVYNNSSYHCTLIVVFLTSKQTPTLAVPPSFDPFRLDIGDLFRFYDEDPLKTRTMTIRWARANFTEGPNDVLQSSRSANQNSAIRHTYKGGRDCVCVLFMI
jgi:hypothetical protein